MKYLFIILVLLFYAQVTYSQDSVKTGRPFIQIQGYPDTQRSIVHTIESDKKNGMWFRIHSLEEADPSIKYFIKEKYGNAIIEADKNNKNGFYITPISKNLKKLSEPNIELEIWVSFKRKNLYLPVRKSPELPYSDNTGKIIEENVIWKNYKDFFVMKSGKILISTEAFPVKL